MPNIKNVNEKSILDVALELSRLVEQGKNGSLSVEDITGTTITLSNIGNIGGTVLHPVITSGQVCIGALGQAKRVPVFDIADGKEIVVGKTILSSSWNADHRVVDGATMARFVKRWKELVENPGLMLALGK